jgi:hypothetical protein
MIIDAHTHVQTKKIWLDYQKKSKNKIEKVISFAMCNTKFDDWLDVKQLLKFSESEPNIFVVGSIDMDKNISQQIKEHEILFKNKKIIGIKLYSGYQHFYPSDKSVYPIAKLCAKYNKPLIFHSGSTYPTKNNTVYLKYSQPAPIDELATLFPETKIIIAHLGFPFLLETANIVSKNHNVFADISGTIDDHDSRADLKKLTIQYIKDLQRVFSYFPDVKSKLLFGTDYGGENTTLKQVIPYIKVTKKIFNKKERENVFNGLANKLFFG